MQPNDGIQSTYENIKAVRTRDVETGRFTAGPLLNYSEGLHAEMGTISKALKIPGLPKPPKPAGATGGILKPRKPRIGAPNTVKAPTVPSTKIATPKSPRVKQTGVGKALSRYDVKKAMPDQSAVNVMGNTKVLRPRKKGTGPMVLKRPHER